MLSQNKKEKKQSITYAAHKKEKWFIMVGRKLITHRLNKWRKEFPIILIMGFAYFDWDLQTLDSSPTEESVIILHFTSQLGSSMSCFYTTRNPIFSTSKRLVCISSSTWWNPFLSIERPGVFGRQKLFLDRLCSQRWCDSTSPYSDVNSGSV